MDARTTLGTDLYDRSMQTLVASWTEYARGAIGAAVLPLPGVAVAVFPVGPEREFYNNALIHSTAVLERGLATRAGNDAVDALEVTYGAARINRYAVWVHETEYAVARLLERRGYTVGTVTRAMGMHLDEIRMPRPTIDFAAPNWDEHVRINGLSPDYLGNAHRDAYHILIARVGSENVSTAMALDVNGDCGVYNVGTLDRYRRRGLATALTAAHLHDALARGCSTASLQSTPMAEGVYAAVGFRDLGRIIEYVPPFSAQHRPPL